MIWSPDRGIFHEIKITKNYFFDLQCHEQFLSYQYNHEIESLKIALCLILDLMKNLLLTSTIMRSKIFKAPVANN
jgi:hypothetical protein